MIGQVVCMQTAPVTMMLDLACVRNTLACFKVKWGGGGGEICQPYLLLSWLNCLRTSE